MSTMRTTRASQVLGLVAAGGLVTTLLLGFFPVRAEALVDCGAVTAGSATDTDGDGLTDYQECQGINSLDPSVLFAGTLALLTGGTSLPTCAAGVPAADRPNCVDPNTKDFFLVFERATPSLIPANPAQFISKALSAGGLAITVHELAGASTNRIIISGGTQKYLIVAESLALATATDDALGYANQGTVNSSFAFATVFTQRIHDYHASVYANVGAVPPAGEVDTYTLHTVAHEVSHNYDLCACPSNSRYGGRHYKTGTNVVMEQSVKVTVQGNNVTFFISDDYPSQDQTGAKLK